MSKECKIGIIGDSSSLERLFGVHQRNPLSEGGIINWFYTATGAVGGVQYRVWTASLLNSNKALQNASSWVSTYDNNHDNGPEELDIIILSFSVSPSRCFMNDPAFIPAFTWADHYFGSDPSQVAVLLVPVSDSMHHTGDDGKEALITNLIAGEGAYLTKLMAAKRIKFWDNGQLLVKPQGATRSQFPAVLQEDGLKRLCDLYHLETVVERRLVVARNAPFRRNKAASGMGFIHGLVACSLIVAVAAAVLLSFRPLQRITAGFVDPKGPEEVAALRDRIETLANDNKALEDTITEISPKLENATKTIVELNARLDQVNEELTVQNKTASQAEFEKNKCQAKIETMCKTACGGERNNSPFCDDSEYCRTYKLK